MITYSITSRTSPQNKRRHGFTTIDREALDPKDPDYKQKLFDRVRQGLRFKVDQRVRVHGSPVCGTIKRIYWNLDDVQWENDKPYFIEVDLDNGECYSYHPGMLTTKRVRNK